MSAFVIEDIRWHARALIRFLLLYVCGSKLMSPTDDKLCTSAYNNYDIARTPPSPRSGARVMSNQNRPDCSAHARGRATGLSSKEMLFWL